MTVKVLIVDDEPDICELLKEILEDEHYEVETAHNAKTARPFVKSGTFDLVLLDIWMPGEDGISLLKEWKKQYLKNVPVIMMSGHGTVETAVQATRFGAEDFLEKPITMARLLSTISKAMEKMGKQPAKQNKKLQIFGKNEFIGSSQIIEELRDKATIAAIQQKHMLLIGETGSGKHRLAKMIHKVGSGEDYPFVELGAKDIIKEQAHISLLGNVEDGELHKGLLEQAEEGSLYIEDVTKLPELFRKTLLKVMDSGTYSPMNSREVKKLNCRIIFSTNENIQNSTTLQNFRQDLLYCISVVSLVVPALREHSEDIPTFLDYFVNIFVENDGMNYRHFPVETQNYLRNYHWPGNVNELKNMVQQLLLFGKNQEVSLEEVKKLIASGAQKNNCGGFEIPIDMTLREAREQFERFYLESVLKRVDGSVTKLAKISGMERTHLYRKLKALGISPK